MLAYVSVYRCVRVRESVPQYGPRPPGLCTSVYFRAVRVSPAFVRCESTKTLCFGVLYELRKPSRGASLQRLCASVYRTSARNFARCEPTKALCLCVPYERQELCAVRASKGFLPCTSAKSFARCEPPKAFYRVRAPRALRGASLQRLCASVCCKSLTSFVRCEPTKTFYRVLVLAPQDL